MARNRTLDDIYRFLKPAVLRLMLLGKSRRPVIDDTYQEHRAIIAALRKRDRTAYAYLLGRHLEFGAQFIGATDNPRPSRPGEQANTGRGDATQ